LATEEPIPGWNNMQALFKERGGGVFLLAEDGETLVVLPFVNGKITEKQIRDAAPMCGYDADELLAEMDANRP